MLRFRKPRLNVKFQYFCGLHALPPLPGTHYVDKAALELRELPASAELGLKVCVTTPGHSVLLSKLFLPPSPICGLECVFFFLPCEKGNLGQI